MSGGFAHGWWVVRAWSEVTRDFEQSSSAGGRPTVVQKNGVYFPYGVIRLTTWRYVTLDAVTSSPTPPGLDLLDELGNLVIPLPASGSITTLPVSGGAWEHEAVETSRDDEIMPLYKHDVLWKSGSIEETPGFLSDLNVPLAPPAIEEPSW